MKDETREQIESASKEFANDHPLSHGTWYDKECSFRAGATHQHPIGVKEGYNQAIDEIKAITSQAILKPDFLDKLEKLRKP